MGADTKTVDVLAVLCRLCANVEFVRLKRQGEDATAAIAELIGADKEYDRIRLAPYDRHDPVAARKGRAEFLAAQERRAAALRACGGAE